MQVWDFEKLRKRDKENVPERQNFDGEPVIATLKTEADTAS